MIAISLAELAGIVGGQLAQPAGSASIPEITGEAFVDSRAVVPGGLFVALVGERVDGHDYAAGAVAAGAAAVLGSRPTPAPTVVVADPVAALGTLAGHLLSRAPQLRVLALTGSQGKTGTKDFLAAVLADAGPTVATAGNFNNEIGVPLTVLRATSADRYLAVEMGARGLGHIGYLCQIAPPEIAAVLNVGTAHLGEFGSREAIAQAKGEIIEALPADGVAVLNADDPLVAAMAPRTNARCLWFGAAAPAASDAGVTWRGLSFDEFQRPSFEIGYADRWCPVRLNSSGAHQVPNAVAAGALALAAGVDLTAIADSLSTATASSKWRMELTERPDGALLINDAYNANPDSMRAAIDSLIAIAERRGARSIAVLGGMFELGGNEEAEHRAIGSYLADQHADVLVSIGPLGANIAEGARSRPDWRGESIVTPTREEAVDWLRQNVSAGDVVLIKASRGAALEVVAQELSWPPDAEPISGRDRETQ